MLKLLIFYSKNNVHLNNKLHKNIIYEMNKKLLVTLQGLHSFDPYTNSTIVFYKSQKTIFVAY